MRGFFTGRLRLAVLLCIAVPAVAMAGDAATVSTMRNVNAVLDAQGFRINPAFDHSGQTVEGDLAPVQAFEVLRPDGKAFSIGRLYTSCTCIQLESPKRNFDDGERAIMRLRNITPTPTNGQIYAIYVQITSPIRAVLRFDTFVQSNNPQLAAALAAAKEKESAEAPAAAPPPAPIPVPAAPVVEEAEGAAPAIEDRATAAGAEIAAEAEARVRAATDAASDMAASMDDYFAEMSGSTMPEALPPPQENIDDLPPPPDAPASSLIVPPAPAVEEAPVAAVPAPEPEPAPAPEPEPEPAPESVAPPSAPVGGIAAGLSASGTRLEEAYQSAASGRLAHPGAPREALRPGAKKPHRNVSLITIGVKDLFRSMRFYEALGWEMAPRGKYDRTAFFQLNGQVLVLYPIPELLKEQNMEGAEPAPGGVTLAIHVASKEEVLETYRSFINAGGTSLKEPTEMLSGSVTSYVADPDGNPWEISWVPQFRVDEEGWLWLP